MPWDAFWVGSGISDKKNNSAEDVIDETNGGLCRWNSDCSAEQKTLWIPFWHSTEEKNAQNSVPWNKNQANSRNSFPNNSVEEKTTRNFRLVPKHFTDKTCSPFCLLEQETFVLNHFLKTRQPKISKLLSEKRTFQVQRNFVNFYFGCFAKQIYFALFRSGPLDSSVDIAMPRNEHFLPRNSGNRSESIPRNFAEQNSVPNTNLESTIVVSFLPLMTFSMHVQMWIIKCYHILPVVTVSGGRGVMNWIGLGVLAVAAVTAVTAVTAGTSEVEDWRAESVGAGLENSPLPNICQNI